MSDKSEKIMEQDAKFMIPALKEKIKSMEKEIADRQQFYQYLHAEIKMNQERFIRFGIQDSLKTRLIELEHITFEIYRLGEGIERAKKSLEEYENIGGKND